MTPHDDLFDETLDDITQEDADAEFESLPPKEKAFYKTLIAKELKKLTKEQ